MSHVAHLYKRWAWSFVTAGTGILSGYQVVGTVDTMGSSGVEQGVITTSDCSNSCRYSCRIGLFTQGWIEEEYSTRRNFHKCTRVWIWEVTEVAGKLLCVSQSGCLATPVQMNKGQRMIGLLACKPVAKIRWHGKAFVDPIDLDNICILFAFGGITYRSKITQTLKDWHGEGLKQWWSILIIC